MNYLAKSGASQSLDLTLNYDFSDGEVADVLVTLKKEGNSLDTQSLSGIASYNGYYATVSATGWDLDNEAFYSLEISKDSKEIYKGKAFVTNQTIGEYEMNNDNYVKESTNTSSNEFIIFED